MLLTLGLNGRRVHHPACEAWLRGVRDGSEIRRARHTDHEEPRVHSLTVGRQWEEEEGKGPDDGGV